MEQAVARSSVPHSGDSAESPASAGRARRGGLLRLRRARAPQPAAWVLVLFLVALVPLLVATWTFGRGYRTSEIGQVDARLTAAAGSVSADVQATTERTSRLAASLAGSAGMQHALLQGKTTTLLLPPAPKVHVEAVPGGKADAPPRASVSSAAFVGAGQHAIGHVTAWVPLSSLLAHVSAKTGVEAVPVVDGRVADGPLRGSLVTAPADDPHAVRVGGRRYRVLRQPLGGGVAAVLLVPYAKIESTVFRRELPTVAAGAVTLVALGLLLALALPWLPALRRGRAGDDWSRPVALVGDVAVAAHDPDALLPVILETALAATQADGGTIVWEGHEIVSRGLTGPARRVLALPIGDESRPDAGQLLLYRRRQEFSARDKEVVGSLVAQGRIALENARLQGVVRRQAQTDELTDLANRRRFMAALEREIARSGRLDTLLSLVLFDLDRFKRINDRCGHQVGDVVLRRTAEVVRSRIRETDLAARIGGEEFAVLLPGSDAAGAATFADELRRDLEREVVVEGVRWPTTASFGVAEFRDGMSVEMLVGAADRALYEAKAAGRNTVRTAGHLDTGSGATSSGP